MVSLEYFVDIILPAALWPGVDLASNRKKYRENVLGVKGCQYVGLSTKPSSSVDFLAIWEPQTPGILRVSPGL
jgi:hypothetical protein